MSTNLGEQFEQSIIAAAGLEGLNIDPGSMRIDLLNSPITTVRFTLVVDVPGDVVREAIASELGMGGD